MPNASSRSVKVFWPRYSRAELIALLRHRAATLPGRLPLTRAALFGSWAAARATAFSDVDVLVVYTGPPRSDAYDLVWEALAGVPRLELHLYTEEQARQLAPTLARMTEGAVDLL